MSGAERNVSAVRAPLIFRQQECPKLPDGTRMRCMSCWIETYFVEVYFARLGL
jgi:hypothetical protein